jgi:HEAT repeat protein
VNALIPSLHLRSHIVTGLCTALLFSSSFAQNATKPVADNDDAPATTFDSVHATAAQDTQEAWSLLTTAAADTKHLDLRIQALAALGTMGANPRSTKMIATAMSDSDLDVRTAAVLAAGESKNRSLTKLVRAKLDDNEPQVAFAAAITLAKIGDRSGEDLLIAVVNGERKAGPGIVNGTMHTVNKDFHNPSNIAKIGALQGASMLLGPFGFGVTAYEYLRKNGGDTSRVTAIEELTKVKSSDIHATLIDALGDKDPGVRASAAKALGDYRDTPTASPLLNVFTDAKAPVRLTAAASFLRSTSITATK